MLLGFRTTPILSNQDDTEGLGFFITDVSYGNELRFRLRCFFLTRAVRQRVENSAPFLFLCVKIKFYKMLFSVI